MKTKILILVVGLASFVLGAIAMSCWRGYAYTHWMVIPKEVEVASRAEMDAVALAHLRMNEPKAVIQQLEAQMDGAVFNLAQWDESATPNEKIRKSRDRCLVAVKVYHESYPASGDVAARINPLLATIRGRNTQKTCNSSICRLDDLHRSAGNTNSNSISEKAEQGGGGNAPEQPTRPSNAPTKARATP